MRPLLIVIISLAVLAIFIPDAAQADGVTDTVNGYLNALTGGDTTALKTYIGGRFYNSRKTLLEKNPDYSKFLRNYYNGVEFRIVKLDSVDQNSADKVVTVEFLFPGDNISMTDLVVSMDSSGRWKIIDEKN